MDTQQLLQQIPQQKPFRFVDEIVSVDEQSIVGRYRFREDEWFYAGHFPGQPVTPGVILVECMCQIGVVALGIYCLSKQIAPQELADWVTLFTDVEAEFRGSVYPGDTVTVRANKVFFRRMKMRATIEMVNQQGDCVATCTAAGQGVRQSAHHD